MNQRVVDRMLANSYKDFFKNDITFRQLVNRVNAIYRGMTGKDLMEAPKEDKDDNTK